MVKHRSHETMFNPNTNTNAYHTSGIGLGVFVSAKRQDPRPESESHTKGQREWVRVTRQPTRLGGRVRPSSKTKSTMTWL